MPEPSNQPTFHTLAGAIDVDSSPGTQWSSRELGEILRHQLRADFRNDLAALSPEWAKRFDQGTQGERNRSLGQILTSAQPGIELLQLIKDFAKRAIAPEDASLPEELGGMLYYASISCAWVRLGTKLHSLNNEGLKTGLTWAVSQPWITAELKALFQSHLAQLAG